MATTSMLLGDCDPVWGLMGGGFSDSQPIVIHRLYRNTNQALGSARPCKQAYKRVSALIDWVNEGELLTNWYFEGCYRGKGLSAESTTVMKSNFQAHTHHFPSGFTGADSRHHVFHQSYSHICAKRFPWWPVRTVQRGLRPTAAVIGSVSVCQLWAASIHSNT